MGRLYNRGKVPLEIAPDPATEYRLPTSRELLESTGAEFDYFIDSFEGTQIHLDAEGIKRLAEGARQRLEQIREEQKKTD